MTPNVCCRSCGGSGVDGLDGLPCACITPVHREQASPIKNEMPAVWGLVMEDMKARDVLGERRYGTRLQPHNGRKALRDAYEEALDLVVYLRQELYEREGK